MSDIKKNSLDVYKKRQKILIITIGTIIVLIIFAVIYFTILSDNKYISQSTITNSISDNLDAIPVDGQEETIDRKNIKFANSTITVEIGKKITPEFSFGSVEDIFSWESSNNTVAVVNENGVISGISAGVVEITATVRDTYMFLPLTVEVIPPADGSFSTLGYEIVEKEGITYVDGILIANKTYSLPEDYAPGEDSEALSAFETMQTDAENEGLDIYISSGFRSYEDQDRIYNNYASYDGYEAADTYSARPGHSEHQTGLAFDLNTIDDSFAYTPEGEWVKNNAHKYGFIIRYPEGKEHITGYMYESWHIRYLGVETATSVYESGLTLEEYLGIDSVYSETSNEDTIEAE